MWMSSFGRPSRTRASTRARDRAASIERRLDAMRQFYEAGVTTVCQLAPIFPGITDVKAIIEAVQGCCNLVWLEDLNLWGDYRARIMGWVHENRPDLDGLYRAIYSKKDRSYWAALDEELRAWCAERGFAYLRDHDSRRAGFGEPPVVVNYFYHSEVKKSAKQ